MCWFGCLCLIGNFTDEWFDVGPQYDGNVISGDELGNLYQSLAADFPIVTIEDPFDEDDWKNWSKYVHYHSLVWVPVRIVLTHHLAHCTGSPPKTAEHSKLLVTT